MSDQENALEKAQHALLESYAFKELVKFIDDRTLSVEDGRILITKDLNGDLHIRFSPDIPNTLAANIMLILGENEIFPEIEDDYEGGQGGRLVDLLKLHSAKMRSKKKYPVS